MARIIISFVAVFFLFSCGTAQKKGEFTTKSRKADYTKSAKIYMPLAVGNKWLYEVDYLGQKGTITVEIKEEKDGWYIDNREGKLMIDRRGVRDEQRYLLQFPLIEKRQWLAVIRPGETEHFSIEKVADAVKTPAGSWDTAVVVKSVVHRDAKNDLVALRYFVPKVGMVKIVTVLQDRKSGKTQPMTSTVLTSFSLVQ